MRAAPAHNADRLAEVEPSTWDDLLARLGRNDVYFQRDYVESACLLDAGRPAFLHLAGPGGEIAFACIVRDVPAGGRDVTTPYGYGGPVAAGPEPPFRRFYELYDRWCAANGIVSTFVRFHPLLANHAGADGFVHLERLAGTIAWPLEGDLPASMHRHHQRVVRKAEAAGVAVSVEVGPSGLDDFRTLYEETMRRRSASGFYFFPPAYWEALSLGLRDLIVRFDASLAGERVAAILCFASPPWLHYHLGASLEEGRAIGASHLLMLRAAGWAQEGEFERFHLGGGVGGREDSLFTYKRRFAPQGRCEAWVGKAVHDSERYRALAGSRTIDYSGFFPVYRR